MNISHLLKKLGVSDWSYWMQVYGLGLAIGLALVIGVGFQAAQAWRAPGANPPGSNVGEPITASTALQTKAGSLGIGGNLTLQGLFEMDYSSTYDVYIRGKVNNTTFNRAVMGRKDTDTLYINQVSNQVSDYANGTIIGGPVTAQTSLTSPKICLPNSNASNCRTSWPDSVDSYNDLPSGALAGYCRVGRIGGLLVPPIYSPAYETSTHDCACVSGWTLIMTGASGGSGGGINSGDNLPIATCIKN
ncbi:MAG: hypothetical protein Q7R58_01830 [bacterium]|nr:hypothetical protein [bacterium]